jgi:hypothetical protein
MAYYRLLEKEYAKIQQNEPEESCLRKEFARVARIQTETDDKIISLLTRWKQDKQAATDSHFSQMIVDPFITQKADKIRLAMKITATVVILLAIATLATAGIAAAIYAAACLSYILTVLLYVGIPIVAPPVFTIPSAVTSLLIASGACAGAGLLSYMAWCILDHSSAIREDRIQNDKNFKEFAKHYLEKKLHFFPNREDLKDHTLHSIYSQWKYPMQKLSAAVTHLHSKMQLKTALECTQLEAAT